MDPKFTLKIYNYLDENGNKYIISNKSIEYIPVKPSFSSSGVYNGGKYVNKELNKIQYDWIISNLNFAIKNKNIHIKDRVKTSGLIIIRDKNKEDSYVLSPDSEEKHKIESLLQEIILNKL